MASPPFLEDRPSLWPSIVVFGLVAALSFLAWFWIRSGEASFIRQLVDGRAEQISSALEANVVSRLEALERMAARWETLQDTSKESWGPDVRLYLKHSLAFSSISHVKQNGELDWRVAQEDAQTVPESELSDELGRLLERARNTDGSVLSEPGALPGDETAHLVAVKLDEASGVGGYLVASFVLETWLSQLLAKLPADVDVRVRKEGTTLFETRSPDVADERWASVAGVNLPGATWDVEVVARPGWVSELRSTKPGMVLASGMLIAILLAVAIYFLRVFRLQRKELHALVRRLRHAEEEADKRAIDAERSNRELEQFAYVASHDLQEPLRMVASFTQLLEDEYADQLDDEAREYIHFAVDGARRMKNLIRDLLTYSRIGTSNEDFEQVSLAECVGDALMALRTNIEEVGAEIVVAELPVVRGRRGELSRVFQNLIANAVKFVPEGRTPRVEIEAERVDDMWRVSVSDVGIGIAEKYRERVFGVFQRLHSGADYSGTGIGLAVCMIIVENHGGRMGVESTVGEGSTFYFLLPAVDTQGPGQDTTQDAKKMPPGARGNPAARS